MGGPLRDSKERNMGEVRTQEMGVVIPFPNVASRGLRPIQPSNGPRGEILLFTGVRYERLEPNPGPSRPFATDRRGRRRRS